MKHMLLVLVFAVVLPIYGQKESPKPNSQQDHAENAGKPSPRPVPQNTPQTESNRASVASKSYLSRLFSPENLPNVGLFIAGIGGIVVAIYTLKSIKQQVGLMDGQLKEMQKQAGLMDRQAHLMVGQLSEMQAAGKQIGEQIELARKNIDLILNKERSHLRVELEKLDIPADTTYSVITVEYTVKLYGPTLATVVESEVSSTIEDTDSPPTGPYLSALFIPTIITPSDGPQKARTIVEGHSDEGAQDIKTIGDVKAGTKFVHCWGYIHYRDVFGRDQWTRFRNVWKYDPWESMGKFGDWRPCGPQEDNSAT